MQTFLPSQNYNISAKQLDPSRLGNQAYREGGTLINGGWPNHPCAKMWAGHRHQLALYCLACLDELNDRGRYYPTHIDFFQDIVDSTSGGRPSWLGDEMLHSSHRACLLYKKPEWYGRFGWKEEPSGPVGGKWPYWWPRTKT